MRQKRKILRGAAAAFLWALIGAGPAPAQEGAFDIQEKCDTDFRVAMEYWRARQVPKAHDLYTNVVEACPDRVEAFFYKGRCETDMQQWDVAIRTLRAGLDVDPSHQGVKENLAFALLQNDQKSEGIDVYKSLLVDSPGNIDYWLRMGHAAQQVERTTDAIMAASQALELRPDSLDLWKNFDYYLTVNRLLIPSIQTSEKIYFREPANITMMSRLGKAYADVKLYSHALPVYEDLYGRVFPEDGGETEAVEFDRNRANDMWQYATVLKGTKQFEKAAKVFSTVLRHEAYAENASAWVNVAFIYKDAKQYDKAVEAAQNALRIDSANCAAMCALGKGYEGQGLDREKSKNYAGATSKIMEARGQFELCTATCQGTWQRYAAAELERHDKHLTRIRQKSSIASDS